MTILQDIAEGMDLNKLQGLSADAVKNGFFANYLGALVLLRVQDLKALKLIKDRKIPAKFHNGMSDLAFWGRALFHPGDPEVKKRISLKWPNELQADAVRVLAKRVEKMLQVLSKSPEDVDWSEVIAAIKLLEFRFRLNSSYTRRLTDSLLRWERLSPTMRRKAVTDAEMYLMQSDKQSALLPRLRATVDKSLDYRLNEARIISFKRLVEDGEATSTGNIASNNAIVGGGSGGLRSQPMDDGGPGTKSNTLASLYKLGKLAPKQLTRKGKHTFRGSKIVKKRKKNFTPKKFKAPDWMSRRKED